MFAPESPYKAYCFTCWWSDNWDGKTYGREYDFSKPFFEQFKELLLAVPRPGKIQQGNTVNSFYTNRVSDLKNSYLSFGCNMNEDLQYCLMTGVYWRHRAFGEMVLHRFSMSRYISVFVLSNYYMPQSDLWNEPTSCMIALV
jgi:hypothetical protein